MNKAITDTGPPLHLNQIGYLRLFNIFEKIVVSRQVKEELQKFGTWPFFIKKITRHLQEIVTEDEITEEQDKRKDLMLHRADLSVLVLMWRMIDALALTDDLGLRRAIESLGRVVVGKCRNINSNIKIKALYGFQVGNNMFILINICFLIINSKLVVLGLFNV